MSATNILSHPNKDDHIQSNWKGSRLTEDSPKTPTKPSTSSTPITSPRFAPGFEPPPNLFGNAQSISTKQELPSWTALPQSPEGESAASSDVEERDQLAQGPSSDMKEAAKGRRRRRKGPEDAIDASRVVPLPTPPAINAERGNIYENGAVWPVQPSAGAALASGSVLKFMPVSFGASQISSGTENQTSSIPAGPDTPQHSSISSVATSRSFPPGRAPQEPSFLFLKRDDVLNPHQQPTSDFTLTTVSNGPSAAPLLHDAQQQSVMNRNSGQPSSLESGRAGQLESGALHHAGHASGVHNEEDVFGAAQRNTGPPHNTGCSESGTLSSKNFHDGFESSTRPPESSATQHRKQNTTIRPKPGVRFAGVVIDTPPPKRWTLGKSETEQGIEAQLDTARPRAGMVDLTPYVGRSVISGESVVGSKTVGGNGGNAGLPRENARGTSSNTDSSVFKLRGARESVGDNEVNARRTTSATFAGVVIDRSPSNSKHRSGSKSESFLAPPRDNQGSSFRFVLNPPLNATHDLSHSRNQNVKSGSSLHLKSTNKPNPPPPRRTPNKVVSNGKPPVLNQASAPGPGPTDNTSLLKQSPVGGNSLASVLTLAFAHNSQSGKQLPSGANFVAVPVRARIRPGPRLRTNANPLSNNINHEREGKQNSTYQSGNYDQHQRRVTRADISAHLGTREIRASFPAAGAKYGEEWWDEGLWGSKGLRAAEGSVRWLKAVRAEGKLDGGSRVQSISGLGLGGAHPEKPRTEGFFERLDMMFGPGSIFRGMGPKPRDTRAHSQPPRGDISRTTSGSSVDNANAEAATSSAVISGMPIEVSKGGASGAGLPAQERGREGQGEEQEHPAQEDGEHDNRMQTGGVTHTASRGMKRGWESDGSNDQDWDEGRKRSRLKVSSVERPEELDSMKDAMPVDLDEEKLRTFAGVLQTLVKGKREVDEQSQEYLSDMLHGISKLAAEINNSLLQRTGLGETMEQVSRLKKGEIPFGDKYNLQQRAKIIALVWRTRTL